LSDQPSRSCRRYRFASCSTCHQSILQRSISLSAMARGTVRTLQFETLTPPRAILAFLPLIEGVLGVVINNLDKVAMS
jgi:hypothetical protein